MRSFLKRFVNRILDLFNNNLNIENTSEIYVAWYVMNYTYVMKILLVSSNSLDTTDNVKKRNKAYFT